jgi:hypothetical protein
LPAKAMDQPQKIHQPHRPLRGQVRLQRVCGSRLACEGNSPDNTETPATPDLCGSGFIREEGGAAATAFANEFAPTDFQATPKQRPHRKTLWEQACLRRHKPRQHRNTGHTAKPCGSRLACEGISPDNTETPATPDLCGSGFIREEGGAATTAFANEFAPTGFAATERTPTKWTLTNEPTQNPAPHTPFMQPKIFHRCAVR